MFGLTNSQLVGIFILIFIISFIGILLSQSKSNVEGKSEKSDKGEKKPGLIARLFDKLALALSLAVGISILLGILSLSIGAIYGSYKGIKILHGYQHPKEKVFVEEFELEYTPNLPLPKKFQCKVQTTGLYRAVCTKGYVQHNLPNYSADYTKYIPCSGAWIPNAQTKVSRHPLASQLIYINGKDMSSKETLMKLEKGQKVVVSVMPNIGKIFYGRRSIRPLFTKNTGRVHIVFERLVE